MSQNLATDIKSLTPGIGEDHKYLCENIDIIKANQTNPSACNEALKTISRIIQRCFNIKTTITILDTVNDNDFFGIDIYPDFQNVRDIVDLACDDNTSQELILNGVEFENPMEAAKETWRNVSEWHIDLDAKVFFSYSQRFTPREIVSMIIYEIEKVCFSFEVMHIVYRSIKHMMLNIDYRTQSISKSSLCRNFYIIPFIQACGYVNFKSELPEESLIKMIPQMETDYLSFVTKLSTQFTTRIIDKPSYELKQELSYILTWIIEAVNDLKYHMYFLKKSLEEQITAEKSMYVKNLLTSIYKQFANYDGMKFVNESYLPNTPYRDKLKEQLALKNFYNKLQAVGEASQAQLLDKLGRCKRVTQEEIDVLRLEIEKINCVDDKVYYMEKVYDKLAIVNYALDLIGEKETKGKVRDSKDKLLKQKEQLLQIREMIMAKKISPERYGLFIKYPAGYEG